MATDRLTLLPDGRIALRCERSFSDGTEAVVFARFEPIERLSLLGLEADRQVSFRLPGKGAANPQACNHTAEGRFRAKLSGHGFGEVHRRTAGRDANDPAIENEPAPGVGAAFTEKAARAIDDGTLGNEA